MANNSIEYTLRCPNCLRDVQTFNILMDKHEWCPEAASDKDKRSMVLVAIDGHDVSRHSDVKPASEVKG